MLQAQNKDAGAPFFSMLFPIYDQAGNKREEGAAFKAKSEQSARKHKHWRSITKERGERFSSRHPLVGNSRRNGREISAPLLSEKRLRDRRK
jgi:hypothetical protein